MKENSTNSAAIVASGMTPGILLKTARQEQGLSVVDVASRLCLSVQFIEDIERDDYSHMSAKVYARGHVLSYAHLLGVPESQVVSSLINVSMEFAPIKNNVAIDNERAIPIYQPMEASQQRSSLMIWGSILVLIILIGLVLMWWKGPSAPEAKTPTAAPQTAISIQPQSAAPRPAPAPTSTSVPMPAPNNNSASSSAAPLPAPVPSSAKQQPREQTALQPTEFRNGNNPPVLPAPRDSHE